MAVAIPFISAGIGALSAAGQAESSAQNAKLNEGIQKQQAVDSARQGSYAQSRYLRQLQAFSARQKAAFAANRTASDTGSPLRLLEDTASSGAEDLANIRNQANLESWGYRVAAANSRARVRDYRSEGLARAGSSILGGYAQAYGNYGY